MNLLERVLTLLRANLNTVVEKAEDPEKVLQQLQLDMRNQLVQVKTQVATAIAESHKLQKRSKERLAEAELWLKKAEQAVQQGNDDSARTALTRYNDITKQSQRYLQQQKEQEQVVATMRTALRQLETKIAEVETTIDLYTTQKRNALIQQRVFDALSKNNGSNDKTTSRAQEAMQEAEARARALAELHKRDIDTQLEQLSTDQALEQQLSNLKKRTPSSKEPPLLTEGNSQASPLLHPQPQSGTPAKKQRGRETGQRNTASTDSSSLKESDIAHLKKLLESRQTPQ